jgi:hypothetical protein
MALRITQLAEDLQTILTVVAEEAARASGFVQRKRKVTGPVFVQTLALGWMESPHDPLDSLLDPEYGDRPLCSPQAFSQRFTAEAADCLRRVLAAVMERMVAAQPEAIPLLRRFHGVYVEDCTVMNLPAALALELPGCGGTTADDGQAAIKAHVRWEVTTGALTSLTFQPGRQPDVCAGRAAALLPAGALQLADLGFFDLTVLRARNTQGVYWISRVPSHVKSVDAYGQTQTLVEFLAGHTSNVVEGMIRLGVQEQLSCRLVAFRCPPAIVQKRRERLHKQAREKGRKVSANQWALCAWTVFITNVPADRLRPEEVWVLYRVRWQIEFLFKTWKSHGGLGQSNGSKPYRVLCEVYAKLIGLVLRHWLVLLRGGPLAGFNMVKAVRKVRQAAGQLARAIREGRSLQEVVTVIDALQTRLNRLQRKTRRKAHPSARQLLYYPRLMN